MLEFREITLADKQWIQPLLDMSNYNSEEYSFTFLYIWRKIFGYQVARMDDYLLVKSMRDTHPPSYHFPAGSGDIMPVIEAMRRDAQRADVPLVFHVVLTPSVKLLETLYPGMFQYLPLTDVYDYVYDAESLITLKGKKLHAKRNHINRFRETYPDWVYEKITPDNLPEVIAMSDEWCRMNNCQEKKTLRQESCAVEAAIQSFFALQMDGGFIRANGRIVAFSLGDRLNSDTYLVHIEKAYSDVQGAYAVINQEFAAHNCSGYLYINREDDSGQEGLRKAKQSYRPVLMVEKYAAKMQQH